jgi:hypothetical protein
MPAQMRAQTFRNAIRPQRKSSRHKENPRFWTQVQLLAIDYCKSGIGFQPVSPQREISFQPVMPKQKGNNID